jgi:hypothetical protein
MNRIKYLLFFSFVFCSSHRGYGQYNYVPNPSFEVLDSCPFGGELRCAQNWFTPDEPYYFSGSVDLFSTCDTSMIYGVPVIIWNNYSDYQPARTGNVHAGAWFYFRTNYRESLEIQLKSALTINHLYCIGYYVSLGYNSKFAIENLSAYLSDSMVVNSSAGHPYQITAQVINQNGIISDTMNWVLIQGTYLAHGGEQYLTIGNFLNDANTVYDTTGFGLGAGTLGGAYYYIDDVFVYNCDSLLGVEENVLADFEVFPNPAKEKVNFRWPHLETGKLQLADMQGRVLKELLVENESSLDMSLDDIPQGIYLIRFENEGMSFVRKLMKE